MTTLTKIPKYVEFELDLRSLLEGLAERGRLCDSAVEQEADAALSLLRRIDAIKMYSKLPSRARWEAACQAIAEGMHPTLNDDDLPDDEEELP